jgi:membrane associated rhomboid family serine protease
MIPVSDDVRSRTFPIVNVSIIIACTLVFLYEISLSPFDLDRFFNDYAVIPAALDGWVRHPHGLRIPSTAISAAFLHGGWLHLAGNMIYLWVFGDNVEDALGHVAYLAFYLVSAVGAVALQVAFTTDSSVPMLGASGAIAGVLGGYLVLYPRVRVDVLFFPFVIPVQAFWLIIFWFALQLMSGVATIGDTSASSGVAFWAHVGGFITGLAIMLAARPFVAAHKSPSRPSPSRRDS